MDPTDPAVAALRRLLGDSAARRREVAAKLGVNEQSLYQIAAGIPLKSGKPRGIGRNLRAALDAHYPGWAAESSQAASPAAEPTLEEALAVVLSAVATLSPLRWQMARTVLDGVAQHPEMVGDAAAELLHLLNSPSSKRRAAA
jgi:hypothetical protein